MMNVFQNGDLALGYTGFVGFLNTVNAPTPADDFYLNKPLSNLKLTNGEAEFVSFYDPSGPGSYAYRLAPPSPHLVKQVYLEAGSYTLKYDFRTMSYGMNGLQKFEVKLDGAQISADPVWVQVSPTTWGGVPQQLKSLTINIATSGMHSISFGFDSPGFNLDTSPYWSWANRAYLDNFSLTSNSTQTTGTELADRIVGTASDDTIWGLGGNDTIDGGAGADLMVGGIGNDTYIVRQIGDRVVETAGNGTDLVASYVSFNLAIADGIGAAGSDVENLKLMGSGNIDAYGNVLDNIIYANAGSNRIDGDAGVDTVSYQYVTSLLSRGVQIDLSIKDAEGWSLVTGSSGADQVRNIENLTGSNFDDMLTGDANSNLINGGTGADVMQGGDGSDTYWVDNIADQIIEGSGSTAGARDLVNSYLNSYVLGDNLEDARILNTGTADLTGNDLNNTIFSGAGSNTISGGVGTDTVSYKYTTSALAEGVNVDLSNIDTDGFAVVNGSSGSDRLSSIENITGSNYADHLTGNGLSNIIDGGAGVDVMSGGDGDDTYVIDNTADQVIELNADVATGGIDQVNLKTVSVYGYTLGANIENGRILAAGVADLRGNSSNNILYAGVGANILNGDGGNDTVSYQYGVTGATGVTVSLDILTVQYTGGSGLDRIFNVENLTGSNYADKLSGDSFINILTGNSGDDVLNGRAGNDTLIGGSGSDQFVFDTAFAVNNVDAIRDFKSGQDILVLDRSIFSGLAAGSLTNENLLIGSAALNANHHIVYDLSAGNLYYDADGAGGAEQVLFARIENLASLAANDFLVI